MVARLARTGATKNYPSSKVALLINGRFVLTQLARVDEEAGGKSTQPALATSDFAAALEKEVRDCLSIFVVTVCEVQNQRRASGWAAVGPAPAIQQVLYDVQSNTTSEQQSRLAAHQCVFLVWCS